MSKIIATDNPITPSKKIVVLKSVKYDDFGGGVLVVTTSDKEKPMVGEVVSVGEGKVPVPMKRGDYVAYRKYGETRLLVKWHEFIFVIFDDILGVIKKEV